MSDIIITDDSFNTESFFHDSSAQSSWGTFTDYYELPISTINNALIPNKPHSSDFVSITNVLITVTASYECSGSAKVYCRYGFGGIDNIKQEISSKTRIGSGFSSTQSFTKDITSYVVNNSNYSKYSWELTKNYGDYLTICISTENRLPKTFYVKSVTLQVTYTNYTSCTLKISPEGAGTVSGNGLYSFGTNFTLQATPSDGYHFVKWVFSDGSIDNQNPVSCYADKSYYDATAYFELDKINQLFVGTSQPSAIYIDTQEIKEVYVDTTKVYG